jgi:sn-glycerol 3-phosphate transport system permease protein
LLVLPIWLVFTTSTHSARTLAEEGIQWWIGDQFLENYASLWWQESGFRRQVTVSSMLLNSIILGVGFMIGALVISMTAAYTIVFFRFPLGSFFFWMIFITLLFPLEARIIPSYQVVASLNMLDSYSGLILPMISSATGTFFFRQFYRSIPDELLEAAKLDGSGPWRFFLDILLPLSRTMIGALSIILFVAGWNQYLWPLMITTSEDFTTIMLGIRTARGYQGFALAILALIPPLLLVVVFQRRFVGGLLEVYK